ncbi:hypothetical protein FOZ62_018026, partial [Perkinsus olseni]
ELKIGSDGYMDGATRDLLNLITPAGRAPTRDEISQFWRLSGEQCDVCGMLGFISRNFGLKKTVAIEMNMYAGVDLGKGIVELLEADRNRILKRELRRLICCGLELTDDDLTYVDEAFKWKADPLMWLVFEPSFRVESSSAETKLLHGRKRVSELLDQILRADWGGTYTRQGFWDRNKARLTAVVLASPMNELHKRDVIRKLTVGLPGGPGIVELSKQEVPQHVVGVGLAERERVVDRTITTDSGVLKLEAALQVDGTRLQDIAGQEGSIRSSVALAFYRYRPTIEARECLVCTAAESPNVAMWTCSCGAGTFCHSCIANVILGAVCSEDVAVYNSGGQCPACRRSWLVENDLRGIRLEAYRFWNEVILYNDRLCPMRLRDLRMPRHAWIVMQARRGYGLLWEYSELRSWASRLRDDLGEQVDRMSDAQVITSYGQQYVEPLILIEFDDTGVITAGPVLLRQRLEAMNQLGEDNFAEEAIAQVPQNEQDPAEEALAEEAPDREEPAQEEPAQEEPAQAEPAEAAPAEDAPADDAPADDVPPGREEPEEDGGNAEAPQVMTNDDEGRILMRGPKHFPHRNCSKLSNAAAEEQVRLRRRVQAAASQQGSSSTAVREIIGQHGNDFTTVRDERNLHSAYHRANNRANGIERMRNIATDPAGYYEDFSAAIAHFGSSCTRDDRRFLLYSDHNQPMFIWGADRNIESLAQAQTLIFDGTFYSAPAGFEQLWTAIAVVDGFYVPTFFVLMKNRQQTEYERALRRIRDELAERRLFGVVSAMNFVTDYEPGMRAAIANAWDVPPNHIRGCLWHLCKAWVGRIQSTMMAEYRRSPAHREEKGIWLHHICGLPCLPEVTCREAWAELKRIAPDTADIADFVEYMERNYMGANAQYPPSQWCLAPSNDSVVQRTTNPAEGFHSYLRRAFTKAHPRPPEFCKKLKTIQSASETSLNSVDAGIAATSQSLEPKRLVLYQTFMRSDRSSPRLMEYLQRVGRLIGIPQAL